MVNIADKNVSFIYGTEEIKVQQNKGVVTKERPFTTCVIKDDKDDIIAKESVALHHTDANNKLTGREYAFRKAVKTIPNRELRSELRKGFVDTMKRSTDFVKK